jgi:hypothetical protein
LVSLLAGFVATIITMPVIGVTLIYIICKLIGKNNRTSIYLTIDFSTILFIFAVNSLLFVMVGTSVLGIILLAMILTLLIFVIIHWKLKQEIILSKVLKGFWRFTFLMFTFTYLILFFSGMINSMFKVA